MHIEALDTCDSLSGFLGMCDRRENWSSLYAEMRQKEADVASPPASPSFGHGGDKAISRARRVNEIEDLRKRCNAERNALLDWTRPCLEWDPPLLEPHGDQLTALPEGSWLRMRRSCVCAMVLSLLSVFEQSHDFDSALHDLVVVMAHSPWLLSTLEPEHVQTFLHRLSRIPLESGTT